MQVAPKLTYQLVQKIGQATYSATATGHSVPRTPRRVRVGTTRSVGIWVEIRQNWITVDADISGKFPKALHGCIGSPILY